MAVLKQDDLSIAAERLTPQWLAGFFDGEGCVCISDRHQKTESQIRAGKSFPRVQVQLCQSEPTLLTLISLKFFGSAGKIYTPERKGSPHEKKPCYYLRISGKNAKPVLEAIKPYVVLKRKIVDWALEVISLTGERGRRDLLTTENYVRRAELMDLVKQENSAKRETSLIVH